MLELQKALKFLDYFSLITVKANKVPNFTWKEQQSKKLTADEFTRHYNSESTANFGICTGFEALEVIDIDLKVFSTTDEKNNFWEQLLSLFRNSIFDFDKKVVIYKTKNAGYHIIYKSKRVEKNQKLAKLKGHKEAVIETRGLGGYIFVYPENQISELSYFDVKYISDDDRNSLIRICRSFDYIEPKKLEEKKETKKYTNSGATPWDDFNSQNTVWDVVSSDFDIIKDTDKRIFIRRIGGTSPHSGYIYKDDNLMYLFSTGTIYPAEKQINPYYAYTIKHHNGNFSESAKDLYNRGYGARIKSEIPDISKELKKQQQVTVSDFPLDIFPKELQYYISENVNKLSMDADYMGCSILWMFSIILGNSLQIKVKTGWIEKPILWIALIGEAGVGKTPSINTIISPIKKINNREIRKYYEQKEKYDNYSLLTKKEKEQVVEEKKPKKMQFIVNDITLEALTELHQENKNAVGVHKDELAGWFKDMNKYREGSDLEFWLSSWSGESVNMNRKTAKSSYVNHPFIPVIGGIQPDIFAEIATQRNESNGFIDRVLLSYPNNQPNYYNESELSYDLLKWYGDTMTNCYYYFKESVSYDEDFEIQPNIITFSSDAKKEWIKIFDEITDVQRSHDENEYIKSVYPKQKTYIPRLALIIEVINCLISSGTVPDNVSKQSILSAKKLSDYFINSAKRIKIDNLESKDIYHIMKEGKTTFEKIQMIYAQDKDFNRHKVAKALNISRQTIYNYIKKLEEKK